MVASTKPRYSRKAALAAEPEWSHYQLAVFDAIANSNQSLRIGAVAGSGKTTLITGIVNRIPADTKIAVLAFNTHIVETLKQRLPSRITVTTAHGMGYGLLSRYFQGEPIQVEENKYRKIARNLVQSIILRNLATHQSDKQTRKELANFLNHLIRGCQATLIDPTVEGLLHLIDYYGIERVTGWKLAVPLVTIALSEGENRQQQSE
jgi:superfamily I DNA/RNA helicase